MGEHSIPAKSSLVLPLRYGSPGLYKTTQQLRSERLTGLGKGAEIFCSISINATGKDHNGVSSPLEQYIVNPDVTIRDEKSKGKLVVADVGEALFALRFAQLLNAFWTIGIAPYAITGDLVTSA